MSCSEWSGSNRLKGFQLIRDTTNEAGRTAMKINQAIIERQAEQLTTEAQETEVPESLPAEAIEGRNDGQGDGSAE